jgi:leader peptidase (prepilin peptidase)/N-methyltransferase
MEILIGIIVFIYGTVFGSFFNVVGYRLPNNLSLVKPRGSFCPNCKHELKWFELIPVFSYLIQGGKCRECKQKIALFYPLIETLTGLLFLLSYLVFGFSSEFVIALLLSSYFVIVIVSDGKYMIIPDEVTIVIGGLVILVELITYGPLQFSSSIISGIALFGLLYIFMKITSKIFKKESLGGGDIKLEFVIGAALGFVNGIFSIFLGSILALPVALINQKVNKTNMIAFGPFLVIGALIIYFFKLDIVEILKHLSNIY